MMVISERPRLILLLYPSTRNLHIIGGGSNARAKTRTKTKTHQSDLIAKDFSLVNGHRKTSRVSISLAEGQA